ncbi:MAG: hypothetical protein ACHQHN_02175 [Sphingobacteriales bacterium]
MINYRNNPVTIKLIFVLQVEYVINGIAIEYIFISTNMKAIQDTAKHIKTQLWDWVFIKGPELFITIYGK